MHGLRNQMLLEDWLQSKGFTRPTFSWKSCYIDFHLKKLFWIFTFIIVLKYTILLFLDLSSFDIVFFDFFLQMRIYLIVSSIFLPHWYLLSSSQHVCCIAESCSIVVLFHLLYNYLICLLFFLGVIY